MTAIWHHSKSIIPQSARPGVRAPTNQQSEACGCALSAILAALFTVFRAALGDFDVEATLSKPSSIVVYVLFQFAVVVLMMNLIIATMAGVCFHHKHVSGRCLLY
jgi:hypothetical protein